jgi:hypothetical protein
MPFSRRTLVFLSAAWFLVVLYPDPGVLVRSVRHLVDPPVRPEAVAALAARLPDDPAALERAVLGDVVPYASDWEASGVPWEFPDAAGVLRAGRGDCESRAVVLASLLAAKGLPYDVQMSFDHIWVDYPGKVPTASENPGRVLARRDGGGWAGLRWPADVDWRREWRAQVAIYWDPMPDGRRILLFGGLAWILLWNGLAAMLTRPRLARAGDARARRASRTPTPSNAGGPSW